MAYRIRDLQFHYRYFADRTIFKTKADVIEQLAEYHNIDYSGVKDNDDPYENIWDFLATLKNDKERLNWLLEYGEWEIEEVEDYNK